jgi:aminoglycoside phosphotransferase (APT) family kinase protein
MDERAARIIAALRTELACHYPAWGVTELDVAGAGVSLLGCRVETTMLGTLVLRTPWVTTLINDTDGVLDARLLLRQEAALTDHVRAHGIPSPAIRALHLSEEGVNFLASDFVHGDGSPPDASAFGVLMRAIHTMPPPDVALIEGGDAPPHERIATRLSERTAALSRLTGEAFLLPPRAALAAILAPRSTECALLHMDARPANLFTRRGAIVAIIDWGNALIGDPALELARIAECGNLHEGFFEGYGDDPLAALSPAIATLYRLDTVVMLALVFLAEAPNPEGARTMLARARALFTDLRAATAG